MLASECRNNCGMRWKSGRYLCWIRDTPAGMRRKIYHCLILQIIQHGKKVFIEAGMIGMGIIEGLTIRRCGNIVFREGKGGKINRSIVLSVCSVDRRCVIYNTYSTIWRGRIILKIIERIHGEAGEEERLLEPVQSLTQLWSYIIIVVIQDPAPAICKLLKKTHLIWSAEISPQWVGIFIYKFQLLSFYSKFCVNIETLLKT